jgi:hypothetical protein
MPRSVGPSHYIECTHYLDKGAAPHPLRHLTASNLLDSINREPLLKGKVRYA